MVKEVKAYKIQREIKDLKSKTSQLEIQLEKHQDKCKHTGATKNERCSGAKPGALHLGWDMITEYHCPTCLKEWTTTKRVNEGY